MPVIAKRFRSYIGNRSFRSLLLRRRQRQALQPPPIEPTTSLLREEGIIVLTNLPDPPEHPSSLLLGHQQRQALQPPPIQPNISLLQEEGSIVLTNLPDPPEHPSSLVLRRHQQRQAMQPPPIQPTTSLLREEGSMVHTNLPDPPEHPSSLVLLHQQRQLLQPPPIEPTISLLREEESIVLTTLPDPPEHAPLLSLPPDETDNLQWPPPIRQQAAACKEIPTFNSSVNNNPDTIGAGHRCTKLPDPPEQPSSLLSLTSTIPEQDVVVKDTLHASMDKRQQLHPNHQSEATEFQEVQQHVMNTPHQQLLLEEGLTYHHSPLLLEALAPGHSTSSSQHATALLTCQQEQAYPPTLPMQTLAGSIMPNSSLLPFHQSMQNPESMQVDHPTENQNMQNHTVPLSRLSESYSRMEGTTFPSQCAQLHMEVQPLKSMQPESELQATNYKLQPSDIPFPFYQLPMQYPEAMQADQPTTDTEHSNMQHESLSTLTESNLYRKKKSVHPLTSLQKSVKITSIQQSIEILPPKSVRPESELRHATKYKLQSFNDDSVPALPIEPWLLEGEQDLECQLVLAPLQTHHHHQLQSSLQQAFAARQTTQILQLPLLAETALAQDDEISNASSLSLFSSISSAISYADSLFADLLDARIQSATEILVDLKRDADAATSKLDATTALSVENATASYATLVFEEANMYPRSPYASVSSCEKESANNSKVQPSEKRWHEVVALGADVGVDVEKFHPHGLILKRKACDINLDGDTDHDHGQSIRSSLREYDILMNRKGNRCHGNMRENRKFSKVVIDGVCGKLARG